MKPFVWILVCCLMTTFAKTVKVTRPSQLIELFSKDSYGYINVNIELGSDIDFSLVQLQVPLGTQPGSLECFPYTGTFNGKGHSIRNLNIDQGDTKRNAGLFCELKGATIQNLVIEDTCYFKGNIAGALSPLVSESGSVTFRNIKNDANVFGTQYGGGFIGQFLRVKSSTVLFQNCENTRSIIGKTNGGFIGFVLVAKDTSFEFVECKNDCSVVGGLYGTGGFIGNVSNSETITISVQRSTKSGQVVGRQGNGGIVGVIGKCSGVTLDISDTSVKNSVSPGNNAGGLIGLVIESYAITFDVHHSVVSGSVEGLDGVGGFVGNFTKNYQVVCNVNMSNSTAMVKGEQYVGGLFGVIQSSSPSKQTVINIANTRRENSVIGTAVASCGFACVDEDSTYAVKVNVLNSINFGNVQGEKAYGIANDIKEVMNVVNIGSVSGTSKSYSLWKSPITNQYAYALSSSCKTCGTATQIAKNNKDGQYYVVGTQMKISDMLNFVVNQDHQWRTLSFWTKNLGFYANTKGQLSIAHSFTVSFTTLFLVLFLMVQGIFTQ